MIAGVDGCKRGWMVAQSKGWPPQEAPALAVLPGFRAVLHATQACDIVVVDMPIGLPDTGCRACDQEAKRYLGSRGQNRVFYAPPRPTLRAAGRDDFAARLQAAQGNRQGISQAFGLLAKLREVDAAMMPDVQGRVREFHPELAWRHLAGHTLASKKHSAAGPLERLRLLRHLVPGLDDLDTAYPEAAGAAALDDVLDALVGLWVAATIAAGGKDARRLPAEPPPVDARGLRMEIWF